MALFSFSRPPLFSTESLVLTYANLENAKDWWVQTFGCKEAALPGWDDPLPSDIALALQGSQEPTILISDKAEELEQFGAARPKDRPILFCSKLEKAREHLLAKGMAPGAIQGESGPRYFEVSDPEGNVIEVCEEV